MKTYFKTGKKTLSVFMALLMVMTSLVLVAPTAFAGTVDYEGEAPDTCTCGGEWGIATVVAPTCTERGFTMRACKSCDIIIRYDFVAATGHSFDKDIDGVIDDNFPEGDAVHVHATCTTPAGTIYTCSNPGCSFSRFIADADSAPLGHDYSDWYYEAQNGGEYYYKRRDCGRMNYHETAEEAAACPLDICKEPSCPFFEYELDENGNKQVYYKVDYQNEYVTDETVTATDGTVLATGFKTEVLETVYVKKGEAAQCSVTPKRDKTYDYGKYEFTGWSLDKGSLENVTENVVASAQFKGIEVTYHVTFTGYSNTTEQMQAVGPYLKQHVAHGGTIQYNPANYFIPVKDVDNLYYRFDYVGWSIGGANVTAVPIYSDHTIAPSYVAVPKTYKAILHYNDGKTLAGTFKYAETFDNIEQILADGWDLAPKKASDDRYMYSFDSWVNAKGAKVDINHITVPNGTAEYDPALENDEFLFDDEKGIIHLYPSYKQLIKKYQLRVVAVDVDDSLIPGATFQVTGSNGYLVAAGELDANSEVILSLAYDEFYNITVTYGNNTNTITVTGNYLKNYDPETGNIPTQRIKLLKGEDVNENGSPSCTCSCHSFLGRFQITLMNLVYRIFNRKIVCCYDMYARHGDRLVYTAES